MIATRLRLASVVGLVLALLAWGGLKSQRPITAAPAPEARKAPKELLEKRRDAAKEAWEMKLKGMIHGTGTPTEVLGWSERLLDAELALLDNREDRIKALANHVQRTREAERAVMAHARVGLGRQSDARAATYERLNAEIRYHEVAGKAPPPAREPKKGE